MVVASPTQLSPLSSLHMRMHAHTHLCTHTNMHTARTIHKQWIQEQPHPLLKQNLTACGEEPLGHLPSPHHRLQQTKR